MKIFYVLLDLYERVEDEQAKDGCMENKQVKDAAEDALGLDLTDMAKMYPGGFLLELQKRLMELNRHCSIPLRSATNSCSTLQRIIAGKDCMKNT